MYFSRVSTNVNNSFFLARSIGYKLLILKAKTGKKLASLSYNMMMIDFTFSDDSKLIAAESIAPGYYSHLWSFCNYKLIRLFSYM